MASLFGSSRPVTTAFAAESVGRDDMHPVHHRIFRGGAHYRDGRVYLSEEPGFGLDVDWKAVAELKG
jgi:L-alanine-DL-glutamate epimerase-like enolase superfamily enzyme